jgi:AbrB family looped-hinge helix DNA binding protein
MTRVTKMTDASRPVRLTVGENGRLLIPAELRAALGLRAGGPVMARVEAGALVVEPLDMIVRRVQASMRQYVRPGESLVDALIADRRAEAARE